MPDMAPGNLRKLVEELHQLHVLAGWPSLREMAKGQNFSYATVHAMFCRPGERAPKPQVMLTVVQYLASRLRNTDVEATLDQFDALWREAAVKPFEPMEPVTGDPAKTERDLEVESSLAEAAMRKARADQTLGDAGLAEDRARRDLELLLLTEDPDPDAIGRSRKRLERAEYALKSAQREVLDAIAAARVAQAAATAHRVTAEFPTA
jgi:hypothetical protein